MSVIWKYVYTVVVSVIFTCQSALAVECTAADMKVISWPAPPSYGRMQERYEAISNLSFPMEPDLVLLGDSLFQLWPEGQFSEMFKGKSVINFGLGGATFQQLKWAMINSSLNHVKPKNVAILVGTNNLSIRETGMPDCLIAAGTREIISLSRSFWPESHIIYIPILPRGIGYSFRKAGRVAGREAAISFAKIDKNVTILDADSEMSCGIERVPSFIDNYISIFGFNFCKNYVEDNIHLSESGYDILGRVLRAEIH